MDIKIQSCQLKRTTHRMYVVKAFLHLHLMICLKWFNSIISQIMKELYSDYRTGRTRCAYYNISTKVKHAPNPPPPPRAPLLVNFSTMSPVVLVVWWKYQFAGQKTWKNSFFLSHIQSLLSYILFFNFIIIHFYSVCTVYPIFFESL